jgi:hypothetical protein
MLPNAFIDSPRQPAEGDLAKELGPYAKALWDQLLAALAEECSLVTQEWNSYSRKAGWSLRLKRGKRNILYLCPCRGCFTVAFALGDKALQAARAGKLPKRVLKIMDEAPRYAEGTGVRLEVKTPSDIAVVKTLAVAKLEN